MLPKNRVHLIVAVEKRLVQAESGLCWCCNRGAPLVHCHAAHVTM
jgi:hypothetical protein